MESELTASDKSDASQTDTTATILTCSSRRRRVLSVLVLGFVCVVIFVCGLLVGRGMVSIPPTNSPIHSTSVPPIHPNNSRAPIDNEEEWEKNKNRLVDLGCQPRPTTVKVKACLNEESEKHDEDLYPSHLVVMRCVSESSFCGDNYYGDTKSNTSGQLCHPINSTIEMFTVMYHSNGKEVEVQVEVDVHLQCSCQTDDSESTQLETKPYC